MTLDELTRLARGPDQVDVENDPRLLAALVTASREFIGIADLEGRALFVNEAGRRLVGLRDAKAVRSTRLIDYFATDDQRRVLEEILPAVQKTGFWEGELSFRNFDTGELVPVLYNIFPVRDSSGAIIAYGTVTRDLSEHKVAERHRELLINELNHRVKNTLAIVQALASQTFRKDGDLEHAKRVFEGRLFALSRAHDLLTQESWLDANLLDIVTNALSPFQADGRVLIQGPAVRITPKQTVALSMALHELATNAAKYGALSNDRGRVTISWDIRESDHTTPLLRLVWSEEGGPAVQPPSRHGFGLRLIERSVGDDLDGEVVFDYRADGVRCTISVPVAA